MDERDLRCGFSDDARADGEDDGPVPEESTLSTERLLEPAALEPLLVRLASDLEAIEELEIPPAKAVRSQ